MKKEKYTVTGMTCSACSSRVEKAVSSLKGMEKASVNLLTNSMQVEYDDSILSSTDIENAVVNAGYGIGGSAFLPPMAVIDFLGIPRTLVPDFPALRAGR